MSFLASLAAKIIEMVVMKITALIARAMRRKAKDDEIERETKNQADQLKQSETDDEDEHAAQDILSRHR